MSSSWKKNEDIQTCIRHMNPYAGHHCRSQISDKRNSRAKQKCLKKMKFFIETKFSKHYLNCTFYLYHPFVIGHPMDLCWPDIDLQFIWSDSPTYSCSPTIQRCSLFLSACERPTVTQNTKLILSGQNVLFFPLLNIIFGCTSALLCMQSTHIVLRRSKSFVSLLCILVYPSRHCLLSPKHTTMD
jgi:hypothetical protein